jgi:nucleotide-binding universal stress UspA family protein
MYDKILVPLDGSELAEAILPHVKMLAECHGAEIVLVHVVVNPMFDLLLTGPKLAHVTRQSETGLRLEAKTYLEGVATSLQKRGLKVTIDVGEGLVVDTILDLASKHKVDLIALSTHGHSGHMVSLIGSVPYRLMREAHTPVLLIQPEVVTV